jgi:hypothetical protein
MPRNRLPRVMKYLDSLENKCTNCKGVKNNTNLGQISGIQEKLDTIYK